MEHPLHDCRLKIARAKAQFDTLQQEVAQFASDNPYTARTSFDENSGKHTLDFGKPPVLRREWAASVAEIGLNCRSPLNYLVNLLIYKARGEPHGKTQFPIAEIEAKYLNTIRRPGKTMTYRDWLLDGVPEPQRERIDCFQPYNDGDLAFRHPLALLSEINNADEHRTLQAAYVAIDLPMHVVWLPTAEPVEGLKITIPSDIDVEAQITTGHRPQPSGIAIQRKVQVDWRLGVDIVFGGNEPSRAVTLEDLRQVIATTETVVESFAGDLVA